MQGKASEVGMFGGSIIAVVGGLSLSDWGVVIGIALGAIGLIFNKLHKMKIEKQDADFKRQMLEIARNKTNVTIIDVAPRDDE